MTSRKRDMREISGREKRRCADAIPVNPLPL